MYLLRAVVPFTELTMWSPERTKWMKMVTPKICGPGSADGCVRLLAFEVLTTLLCEITNI